MQHHNIYLGQFLVRNFSTEYLIFQIFQSPLRHKQRTLNSTSPHQWTVGRKLFYATMKSSASRSSAARQGANVQDGEGDDAISIEPPVRLTGLARLTSETSSVSNSEANAGQEGIWTDRVEREAKLPAAPAERTRQEPSVPGAVCVPGINASQEESRIGRGKMDVEAPAVPATPNPSQELSYTESRSTLSHEGVTSRQDAGDLADEETAEVLTAAEGSSGQSFPILAELAPNEEDVARRVTERLEAQLAKHVEREIMNRIGVEQERQVITAAAVEVEDESDERICGMSRNCWYLFLLIAACLTAGIVVAVMFVTKLSVTFRVWLSIEKMFMKAKSTNVIFAIKLLLKLQAYPYIKEVFIKV